VGGENRTHIFPSTACRGLTHVAHDTNLNSSTSCCGRLPSREVHHFRLDFNDTNHWAAKGSSRRYDVLPSQGTTSRSFYFCKLVGKPEGKRPFGRPRRRWEDHIKMDVEEVGGGRGDWMELAQDRDRWRALVSTVKNLPVP
jgi:hypothetical protein